MALKLNYDNQFQAAKEELNKPLAGYQIKINDLEQQRATVQAQLDGLTQEELYTPAGVEQEESFKHQLHNIDGALARLHEGLETTRKTAGSHAHTVVINTKRQFEKDLKAQGDKRYGNDIDKLRVQLDKLELARCDFEVNSIQDYNAQVASYYEWLYPDAESFDVRKPTDYTPLSLRNHYSLGAK